MTDTDVIIVGAGPSGLMLAGELRLAGVRSLVLERQSQPRDTPKASGIGGRILDLLRYRGLLDRFTEASSDPHPALRFPFGNLYLDFTELAESPMHALPIPQRAVERLLDEHASELGAEIRRGHRLIGLSQDDTEVTAEVEGPEGTYRVTARYLVGCDGGRSRVRELAGIEFPGTTYPEVNRLAQVTVPDSLRVLDNGDIDVPGLGTVHTGFTRTAGGVFAFAVMDGVLSMQTTEDESAEYDDDEPLTMDELAGSVRRVLGVELPLGDPIRLSRYTFKARQAERYRIGRIMVAGDAAHLFPATGTALNVGMLDTVNLAWKLGAEINGWAPAGLLDTYHDERHFAGARAMMQTRAQAALRRGTDEADEALRQVFQELLTDEPALHRMGHLVGHSDIRYPIPGADRHPLIGTFAPDLPLHTNEGLTSVAELMHAARPVFLDLAERPDLREVVLEWRDRVDLRTAKTDDRPADALLIRPDAHIAWATPIDQPGDTAAAELRAALSHWFGT
ncbi:2-polyprenyl-6-methoxyphenol hydroxylase-like FAD-dependent oxidoreductase [Nocardia tenerifensis]|uniref:2-polyprenyl-6-methoxyphenol hydroxylase-like FAD-dependent oxidoreductase n=1 Tax=Nocardia tenerifensis TaxID=228006 RepID=A0A318JZL6_9NOCA|nr:FAD-dependent monooxygenase [Nocardia tenerifensis]PXX61108.1 2-polyprenyl-6-methoxyphenol hydroxylase-like FAD-dependent oxidoreductase [Nocardia tenerifensis]